MRWRIIDQNKVDELQKTFCKLLEEDLPNYKTHKTIYIKEVLKYIYLDKKPNYFIYPYLGTYNTQNFNNNVISNDIFFGQNVIIEQGAVIGDNVVLEGNNYIGGDVEIGNNVIVKAGTNIGSEGFSHTYIDDKLVFMPHLGKVIIEDDVVIGSNCCIDKGFVGDTILKKNCRLDNLIHVAHNVIIGENCIIPAGVIFGGYVTVEKNVIFGLNSTIKNRITIGEGAYVGMSAAVIHDVPVGKLVIGVPAKEK